MYKNIYYIVQGLPTVEPDMKTVSGTWAQLPRYSMEPSGSAMGDHAWWRDGGRGREGGGGGFVGARKKKKKMETTSDIRGYKNHNLLALKAFSFCTKNFSRASALLQNSDSLEL